LKTDVTARLHKVLSGHPLKRKWLLAQSFAMGHQLIERICSDFWCCASHGSFHH
jgi:hypothetical protein